MGQFTSHDEPMPDVECLENALREFLRLTRMDNGHFWWPGLHAYFRCEVGRVVAGEEIIALNIADIDFYPLGTNGAATRGPDTERWDELLTALSHARAEDDPRRYLLVSGTMPLSVAGSLRATEGCREVATGEDAEFVVDLWSLEARS